MKLRSNLTISLLSVLLLAACALAIAPNLVEPEASTPLASTENELAIMPTPTPTAIQSQATVTEVSPTEIPQVVATSRGPNLEATDPSTYARASGELQFVEFFAFW
jgi:hypothetical protein